MSSWYPLAVLLILLFCGLVNACSGKPNSDVFVVRDSAGISVATSRDSLWDSRIGWTVDTIPLVEIGAQDGPEPEVFSGVSRVLRLNSGRIVIVDGASNEIRFFDPSGMHVLTAGGTGDGPTEFRAISRMVRRMSGDSVAAYDVRLHRFVVYDSSGTWVRTVEGLPTNVGGVRLDFRGWLGDHDLVGELDIAAVAPPSRDFRTVTGKWLSLDIHDRAIDTIAAPPVSQWGVSPEGGSRPVHVLPQQVYAITNAGLWHALPFSYEIRHYSPGYGLDRLVRRSWTPQLLSELQKEGLRAVIAGRLRMPGLAPEMVANAEWAIDNMIIRDSLPAFLALDVDADGNLWVQEYEDILTLDQTRWPSANPPGRSARSVFTNDGRWLGTVAFPDRFTPHDIGVDYVLGVWTDELNVEYVRLYRIRK
jgi:hypothetical protein